MLKPIALGLGLVASIALTAQAQTVPVTPGPSVASLPPTDQGPRAYSHGYQGQGVVAVTPSGTYPGPAAGAGTGIVPPRFEKSAGWDSDPRMKPYETGQAPRPN